MLSFAIMGGCAIKPSPKVPAYRCDKPPLRGSTWADLAILSVEQASSIDVCNIRNGVDVYERKLSATNDLIPTPTPVECGFVGVQVPYDAIPNGVIRKEVILDVNKLSAYCNSGDIGCAVVQRDGTWDIYYNGQGWVRIHERCHARYNGAKHTLEYLATRQQVK